jgi:hypothetical protein
MFILIESNLYGSRRQPEPTFDWFTSTVTKIEDAKDEKPKWAIFTKYITNTNMNYSILPAHIRFDVTDPLYE